MSLDDIDIADHHFPCSTCGADLRFDPATGGLSCGHCGHSQAIDTKGTAPIVELDYRAAITAQMPDEVLEETTVLPCPNCGAQIEFDAHEHARECAFCATPIVGKTGAHRHIKPRGLLPFALSETDAYGSMGEWLGKLWFAPNGLKKYARKDSRLSGIYLPYWTYDAMTRSAYSGERGDDYYVTRTVTVKGERRQVRERRTNWSRRSGRVQRFFDDVLVLASSVLPAKFTEGLAPWDLSEMEPYLPDYLAGFRAQAYEIEVAAGFEQARVKMDRVILRDVKFDIGGDRQRVHDIQTQISDITFKHVLLPVWMAAYKYRGKTYRFAVNARTGRVQGERPYSAWKIAFAVILGLIVAGGVGYLIAMSEQQAI